MLIYFIYFLIFAVLAIEYEFRPFDPRIFLVIISVLLIGMAGFRAPDVARDYVAYQYNFEIVKEIDDPIFLTLLEPGFIGVVWLFTHIAKDNYEVFIMLFFATFSVFLKMKSIYRLSFNPFLVILFYFSHFFILHEMTQIRIGLASAIFLVSLTYYLTNNWKAYVISILVATLFHYSAIYYLLLLLFNKNRFNKLVYGGVIVLSIVLAFVRLPLLNILNMLESADISAKLNTYIKLGEKGAFQQINVFNVITSLNLLACTYLIYFVPKKIILEDLRFQIFLKCNILSVFILCLLSGVPSMAFRFSDLFGLISMFLFAYLAKFLPFNKWNVFFLVAIAGLIFYINGFKGDGLLNEYKFVEIK